MADPIVFSRLIQGELPFTLNLPDGSYRVSLDGSPYQLEILQGRIAVAVDAQSMLIGTPDELRPQLGDRWDSFYKHELRTIVRRRDEVNLARGELPTPDDNQLLDAAKEHILRNNRGLVAGSEQLRSDAQRALAELDAENRARFVTDTSVRLAARCEFRTGDVKTFCQAVNVLVRLYMATFNDFFVQEITESFFSGTAFRGIYVATFCYDQELEVCRHAGGRFPYIIQRPWRVHPQEEVDRFRTQLETSPDPDPVTLLGVRARSFLMRGGYRSALIEASAAFDICLVRKIRSGYKTKKGKTDAEIDQILDRKENKHLDERAKKVLKEATGKSAAEFDPSLWQRFVDHRKRRGKVAHADAEPTEAEATEAVEDMLRLAELVDGIVL